MATDAAAAVHAAVAGGTLTGDTARAILRCIDADGCIDAPNDLLAGIAREVIEAAGVEFRLTKGANLPATPGGNGANRTRNGDARRRSPPEGGRSGLLPRLSEAAEAPQAPRPASAP